MAQRSVRQHEKQALMIYDVLEQNRRKSEHWLSEVDEVLREKREEARELQEGVLTLVKKEKGIEEGKICDNYVHIEINQMRKYIEQMKNLADLR